jgi:hypothetical protein
MFREEHMATYEATFRAEHPDENPIVRNPPPV